MHAKITTGFYYHYYFGNTGGSSRKNQFPKTGRDRRELIANQHCVTAHF
jgi:hypothetical protein